MSADKNPPGAPHDVQWALNVVASLQSSPQDLQEAQTILMGQGYTPDQLNAVRGSGNPQAAGAPKNPPTVQLPAGPKDPKAVDTTNYGAYATYGNPYAGPPVDWTDPRYHDFNPKAAPPDYAKQPPPVPGSITNNGGAQPATAAQATQAAQPPPPGADMTDWTTNLANLSRPAPSTGTPPVVPVPTGGSYVDPSSGQNVTTGIDPLMHPGSTGTTPDQAMGQLMAQRPPPSVDPLMTPGANGMSPDQAMGQVLQQNQDQANAAVSGQYAGVPGYEGSWLQRGGYNPTAAAMLYQDYINPQSQADQDQFMRNFLQNTTGSPTAYNSDITYQMMKAYPTLNILDNPGIPVNPDAPSALIGAGGFGKQMMTPGASMPSASAYIDKLFSPEMVQNPYFNPTASGPGSGGSSDPTQMQIDRVYGAVKSLEPFMSKEGAAYIENNLQAAEAAYKDGLLRSDPTISKMSFLEYLDAIGADKWM